jgi:hypothetical protein
MDAWIRHLHQRDFRFLALIATTVLLIGAHLSGALRTAGQEGSGWRELDLEAVQRRIESGELRDLEAEWYHPSTPEDIRGAGGRR